MRALPAAAFRKVSCNASVENPAQAAEAVALGYAAAIVLPALPEDGKAFDLAPGIRAIPCPAETRGRTCVECRLCLDRDLLGIGRAVAFGVHGPKAKQAVAAVLEPQP